MEKEFKNLCTPAKVYFAIGVLSCIFALFNSMPILAVFVKLIFIFIWAFLLNLLCSKGYQNLSWFLVLLPYILMLLIVVGVLKQSNATQQMMATSNVKYPVQQNM